MGKKLTIEYIREQFEKEGYKLLSKKYVGAHIKLKYVCPGGHRHSITWANWQQGYRCFYCASQSELTIEYIRLAFEKEGHKLLSKEYINGKQKLDYTCPNGHKHIISWNNWQQGQRCSHCYGNVKPTIEFIRTEFAKENYILLTDRYKNAKQKLDYICPDGHRHNISWSNWQKGNRCPYCARVVKPTIEFVRFEFEKEGYKLLTKKYINACQKLGYICASGHSHEIKWTHFKDGHRCPICFHIKMCGPNNPNWKNYSEEDLIKLSGYKNHVSQLTEQNYRKYKSSINPLNLQRGRNKYHLDHVYSIMDGFRNNVKPEIISHPANLQMLLEKINISKGDMSEISLDELYDNHNKEQNQ